MELVRVRERERLRETKEDETMRGEMMINRGIVRSRKRVGERTRGGERE